MARIIELLAARGDVVADGGKEVRGVDGSGQLIPLDLSRTGSFSSAKTRLMLWASSRSSSMSAAVVSMSVVSRC
jgi:hypothetical protein